MSKVENPSAFPVSIPKDFYYGENGMSLRDWFAGQALAGAMTSVPGPGFADWSYYAGAAYAIADAMLAERVKSEGQS